MDLKEAQQALAELQAEISIVERGIETGDGIDNALHHAKQTFRLDQLQRRADTLRSIIEDVHKTLDLGAESLCKLGIEVVAYDLCVNIREDHDDYSVTYRLPDMPIEFWCMKGGELKASVDYPDDMWIVDEYGDNNFLGTHTPLIFWKLDGNELGRFLVAIDALGDAIFEIDEERKASLERAKAEFEQPKVARFCPLLNYQCLRQECAWWTTRDEYGDCGISQIVERASNYDPF